MNLLLAEQTGFLRCFVFKGEGIYKLASFVEKTFESHDLDLFSAHSVLKVRGFIDLLCVVVVLNSFNCFNIF